MNPVERSLSSLILEGHELHASLRTLELGSIRQLHLPQGAVLPGNPHLSTDAEFVEAIARSGSQGSLGSEGIRSALYARYVAGENELGVYGLEAKTDADADARENAVREIWAFNTHRDRARVHRKDLIIVVVWHATLSPEMWEAVNASLVERLNAPGTL